MDHKSVASSSNMGSTTNLNFKHPNMTHFQKESLLTTQLVFKCEILGCVKQQ